MSGAPDRIVAVASTPAGSYYAPRTPSWRSVTSSTTVSARRNSSVRGGNGSVKKSATTKVVSPKGGGVASLHPARPGISPEGSLLSSSTPLSSTRSARAMTDEDMIVNRKYVTVPQESQRLVINGAVVRDAPTEHLSQAFQRRAMTEVLSQKRGEPRGLIKQRSSVPSLQFSSFNESWAVDVFSLPHNATRRELVDLYDILQSMETRKKSLSIPTDVVNFFQWLGVFRTFLLTYFECEEAVIFPWIESRCVLMTDLSRAMRIGTKTRLRAMLQSIFRLEKELIRAKPPVQARRTFSSGKLNSRVFRAHKANIEITTVSVPAILRSILDAFVMELNAYLRLTSSKLLPLIASAFKEKDKRALDAEIARFWWNSPNRGANICILSFWIHEIYGQKAYLTWKYDHLGVIRSMKVAMYEKGHDHHLGIARWYRRREKEALAQQRGERLVRFRSKNDLKIIPERPGKRNHVRDIDVDDHTDLSWAKKGMDTPRYGSQRTPLVLTASRLNSADGESMSTSNDLMYSDFVMDVEEEQVSSDAVDKLLTVMEQTYKGNLELGSRQAVEKKPRSKSVKLAPGPF
mmetsp:Transcript_15414/g.33184  ORF Transcript_15414/g.33184 Transcript_15414/m.33184 type:complete len:575 (+) Transcript_15414:60-1784(+)